MNRKALIDFYLEYFNNWLTIERMSEHFEMPEDDCRYLVDLGKKYHLEATSNNKVF